MDGPIVRQPRSYEELTDTGPVPWALRPGPTAQAQGAVLPEERTSTVAVRPGP
ncbi:hypothetical protein ACFVWY_10825 [Streptomyces sp. NPDC058195]|uniref:hypothetical protein n=1 Tax=Streptomyces sp. NPDC058195 TaxID=3346375 RepID=UPI0036E2CA90